jgi:hypothetical protein
MPTPSLRLSLSIAFTLTMLGACQSEDKSVGSLPSEATPGGGQTPAENGPLRCGGLVPPDVRVACPAGSQCVKDPTADYCEGSVEADCPGICISSTPAKGQCSNGSPDPGDPLSPPPCGGRSVPPGTICGAGLVCTRIGGFGCDLSDPECPAVCLPAGSPQPGSCGGELGKCCPDGFVCIDDPTDGCGIITDCGGVCVPANAPAPTPTPQVLTLRSCGGFGDTPFCPEGLECVDDPAAGCGREVDCGGVCVRPGSAPLQECGGAGGIACPDDTYQCVVSPNVDCSVMDCLGVCVRPD